MDKGIHESWHAAAERRAREDTALVALDFAGTFSEGTYEGTAFAGRIHYDPAAVPSERHVSFAIYEDWPRPVVTVAVGGKILTSQGAAVYDSVFDGTASHFDFVTMYGTGPFDGVEDAAFFELYFADKNASTLNGTQMPSARQLCALPICDLSFGNDAPGNVLSVGAFRLSAAG